MQPFEQIDIETHNVCNRSCGYCPVSLDKRGPDAFMPTELFQSIIYQLSDLGFTGRINLNLYNEPLLDERLDEFAMLIKKILPKAKLHLYTNGDYLNPEVISHLIACGVYSIKITDHNSKPNPKLKLLMASIGNLYAGRVTMHKFNASSALHNRGGALDHPWTQRKTQVCWPGASPHAYVDFKGNMISCCDDSFSETIFGNLKEKTIIDIWESEKYVKFRAGLRKDRFYFEICAKCNVNKGKDIKLEKL